MLLKIQCLSPEVSEMYMNHGSYNEGDSGLDLFIAEDDVIRADQSKILRLGIKASAWEKGSNVSFLIFPRSSISKTPLRLSNSVGLIDSGYRGELMLALDNIKGEDFHVKKGDRLAQAVAFNGGEVSFEIVPELDKTTRGEGGFGSTTNARPILNQGS